MLKQRHTLESVCLLELKTEKPISNNSYKNNIIPKADIEMMREDQYEKTGNLKQKKYKEY